MKGFLKFSIVLLVLVIVITGVGYVMLTFGKKVDVEWTDSDLDSAINKTGVQIKNMDDLNLENIIRGSYNTNGSQEIEAYVTNEEVSAMVASANDESGPLKEFQLKFKDDDQLEISFKLPPDIKDLLQEAGIFDVLKSKNAGIVFLSLFNSNMISLTEKLVGYLSDIVSGKPIYAVGTLVKSGSNSVSVDIDSIKIGSIPLDRSTIDTVEEKTEDFVNTFLSASNGFRIDELRIEDGKLYFKGTLPEELEGMPIE